MKKKLAFLFLLLTTMYVFGQDTTGTKVAAKPNYSEHSKIQVINNKPNTFHSKKESAGVFVNGVFIGDETVLKAINTEKIESLSVTKEDFKKNSIQYHGKIMVTMTPKYKPKFITLKALVASYLDLDKSPIIFQINDTVISQDYSKYLMDENFILKIISKKIMTSKANTQINLIRIITKTAEHIKKANTIRIKGHKE